MANPMKRLLSSACLAAVVLSGQSPVLGQYFIGQNMLWFYRNDGGDPFQAGVNFATTDNPWKPAVIEELKPFKCLRMLDYSMATFINLDTQWSQRRQKTSQDQDCTWTPGDNGVAYEWQIDLCNRTGADLWCFVPAKAITAADKTRLPDYALRLALLIKTGVDTKTISLSGMNLETVTADQLIAAGGVRTSPGLNADLEVYVEYDDEVNWDRFADYVAAEGAKLSITADQFYAVASMRCIAAFDAVFGKTNKRFHRLMSGQYDNPSRAVIHFQALASATLNPDGIKLDCYAIAPYFYGSTWDQLNAAIDLVAKKDTNSSNIGRHKRLCNKAKCQLVLYEMGQHIWPDPHYEMQRDARMYTCYMRYLDALPYWVDGVSVHEGYAGATSWGSKERVGQPMAETPKYRALYDWAMAHPTAVKRKAPANRSEAVAPVRERRALLDIFSAPRASSTPLFDLYGRLIGTGAAGCAGASWLSAGIRIAHGKG